MQNEMVVIARYVQQVLMWFCLGALITIGIVTLFAKCGHYLHEVYRKWLTLDGVGRVVLSAFFCGLWMYGSTKTAGWAPRANAGKDTDLGVIEICSMQTNIIENAGASTSVVTAVQVKFTGSAVTLNTPFWVRNSTSNDWTRINWANGTVTSDLATNIMECVTATNISNWVYWWLGDDLPAVEVETVGITLLNVSESSTSMRFVFTCDNEKARSFTIEYQRGDSMTWEMAAQTSAALTNDVTVNGFWIGETRRWRIKSELEDDEEGVE